MFYHLRSNSWETDSGTDICKQEIYLGVLSGTIPLMVERSKTRQREKWNCDMIILKALAMEL